MWSRSALLIYSEIAMHEIRRQRRRRGGDARRRASPMMLASRRSPRSRPSQEKAAMAPSRPLLLVCALAASVEGWSATPRAPVAAPLARSDRGRREARSRRADGGEEVLPAFFLDVNTNGIVFYSIVGMRLLGVRPVIDGWGFDVVTAGVSSSSATWSRHRRRTSTCAARQPAADRGRRRCRRARPAAAAARRRRRRRRARARTAAAGADARTDPCAAATSSAWPRRT